MAENGLTDSFNQVPSSHDKAVSRRRFLITSIGAFAAGGALWAGIRLSNERGEESLRASGGLKEPDGSATDVSDTQVVISQHVEGQIHNQQKTQFTEGKVMFRADNRVIINPLVFEVQPGDRPFRSTKELVPGAYFGGLPRDIEGGLVVDFVAYDRDEMVFEGEYSPQSSVIEAKENGSNLARDQDGNILSVGVDNLYLPKQ